VKRPWFVLVESNTTGTGRDFAEAARRLGMRPVLLSRLPDRYPYVAELGLDVRPVDTWNADAVLAACRELGLRDVGGITSSSESFVGVAAIVGRRIGLPAPDPAAIALCRDKVTQRRHLCKQRLPVPEFVACTNTAMVARAAAELRAPIVVKPSHGTGSQGVRICENPYIAGQWARRLFRGDGVPSAEAVLVEREVCGPEYSVEVINGVIVGITAKHLGSRPYFVETGHDFPACTSGSVEAVLRSTTSSALRAVGLMTGPAHVELRWDGEKPWLIEINPRLAGGLIPRLIRRAIGRDLVDELVAHAAGYRPGSNARLNRYSSIRFLLPGEGTVASITGLEVARGVRHVEEVACTASPGMRLEVEHSFKDRRGHVISAADRLEDAMTAAEYARGCIEIAMA
jgi:biotin carboxylase